MFIPNNKNPGQNQSAPKTVPEFATHWHSSVPSPNCMLHLQFWDGALLPPAVLGWHLLTCKFFTPSHLQIFHLQYWDGAFSPANIFTCRFGMAPSRAATCTENKNDQAKIQIQTEISETTMKSASTQSKISFSIQNIQTLLKNHEMV